MANLVQIFGSSPVPDTAASETTGRDRAIRQLLTETIRRSTKSRDQIAEEMSLQLDTRITVHMLNGYIAPSKPARFPAAFVTAFCQVMGDDRLQRLLLSPRLQKLIEIGECDLDAVHRDQRKRELREQLLAEAGS